MKLTTFFLIMKEHSLSLSYRNLDVQERASQQSENLHLLESFEVNFFEGRKDDGGI
jgi:hypothetical protein